MNYVSSVCIRLHYPILRAHSASTVATPTATTLNNSDPSYLRDLQYLKISQLDRDDGNQLNRIHCSCGTTVHTVPLPALPAYLPTYAYCVQRR